MSRHKQRLENIEKKIRAIDNGFALLTMPFLDKTKNPPVYIDKDTGEIIPDEEVERMKEEFIKENEDRLKLIVNINIINTPISELDEY